MDLKQVPLVLVVELPLLVEVVLLLPHLQVVVLMHLNLPQVLLEFLQPVL
jgi:hypothetical protein